MFLILKLDYMNLEKRKERKTLLTVVVGKQKAVLILSNSHCS